MRWKLYRTARLWGESRRSSIRLALTTGAWWKRQFR